MVVAHDTISTRVLEPVWTTSSKQTQFKNCHLIVLLSNNKFKVPVRGYTVCGSGLTISLGASCNNGPAESRLLQKRLASLSVLSHFPEWTILLPANGRQGVDFVLFLRSSALAENSSPYHYHTKHKLSTWQCHSCYNQTSHAQSTKSVTCVFLK